MTTTDLLTQPLIDQRSDKMDMVKLIETLEVIAVFIRQIAVHLPSPCIEFVHEGCIELAKLKSREQSKEIDTAPLTDRLLLNFREAAMLLSMSEQSLRDLVHKGQGPENVRRGKRVCFTQEGLRKYVDKLPREYPYQGIIETITADGGKPMSIEEQRVFGT